MKRMIRIYVIAMTVLIFTGCPNPSSGDALAPPVSPPMTPLIELTFLGVTQIGGISENVTTTGLELNFSDDPSTLTAEHITVNGATIGSLSGSGLIRILELSEISVANGEILTVTIDSPSAYLISGSPKTVEVFKCPSVISIAMIPGVVVPVTGESPVTSGIETTEYTGTIVWDPVTDPFAARTEYTAQIILTAKAGYSLSGIAENFFTVSQAKTVSNSAGSGDVTAVFPKTLPPAGENCLFELPENLNFNMRFVPGGVFPYGTTNNTILTNLGTDVNLNSLFWVAETEVTYELWYTVRTWARANGYSLDGNPGREGNDGIISDGLGADPTADKNEPVTTINWREAMVWCNALTEYYNENNGTNDDFECVYYSDSLFVTPIRSANNSSTGVSPIGGQDNPYINSSAKGFRLPESKEWEYAAKYKDGTNWIAGTAASGGTGMYTGTATTDYDSYDPYAWYGNNTYPNGNATKTQCVGTKMENSLGVYDMSGNVWEWCYDWHPTYTGTKRVLRGGSFYNSAYYIYVGYENNAPTDYEDFNVGFRFARTE
ncbi:MAG: formylglycine-generating enzyme family protein [Spirochaetes bacterium]|nr:formylglycine-generating enzyme family protein [Spirochaetota bacterium]MBU0954616.1 formylglycine-generating enzyme family protein [Spirochaetota bacterium]